MATANGIGALESETLQIAWANEILVCYRMEGESGLGKRKEEETVVDQSEVHLQQDSRRTQESAGDSGDLRRFVLRSVPLNHKDPR